MRAHTEFPPIATRWSAEWTRRARARVAATRALRRADGRAATEPTTESSTESSNDSWRRLLDDYLQGWAEADPIKIIRATANEYRFDDPLVGAFSRWALPLYFAELRTRFARSGDIEARDLAVIIDRPADPPAGHGPMLCYREAPRLGLTGVSLITVGAHGVIAETIAYDANLALEVLRAAREQPRA